MWFCCCCCCCWCCCYGCIRSSVPSSIISMSNRVYTISVGKMDGFTLGAHMFVYSVHARRPQRIGRFNNNVETVNEYRIEPLIHTRQMVEWFQCLTFISLSVALEWSTIIVLKPAGSTLYRIQVISVLQSVDHILFLKSLWIRIMYFILFSNYFFPSSSSRFLEKVELKCVPNRSLPVLAFVFFSFIYLLIYLLLFYFFRFGLPCSLPICVEMIFCFEK